MSPTLRDRCFGRLVPLLLVLLALAGCGGSSADKDAAEQLPDTQGTDADATADGVVRADGFDVPDTALPGDVDADSGPKGDLGAPCVGNDDCVSGYCIEGFEGSICTVICVDACPAGYSCRVILDTFPDVVSLCIPDVMKLCAPCQADAQCFGGRCVQLEGGRYCASDCADSACPASYTCTPLAADVPGAATDVCLPVSGACDCRAGKEGQLRSCTVQNEHGTCWGFEACGGDQGWQGCNAAVPLEESCDGVDNDCDGLVDEGQEPTTCERYVADVGTCQGTEVCAGQGGWVCSARLPAPEACNHLDDDCDGQTDEDFKTGDVYSAYQHCGACGVDCAGAIQNAAADHCDDTRELPACVVDACTPPYFKLNEFQCILPPDTWCKECDDDQDCYGSTCVALGGARYCFKTCVDDAACASQVGAACQAVEGGSFCLPVNGTCDCDASVSGARKACAATNPLGTCLGFSTCDPASGWGPCDAREPAAETCNGVDDDCNGLFDDALVAAPCSAVVEGVGTCAGTASCFGSAGWVCSAQQPALETCNLRDDDCDGQTDEDFRGANGLYGLLEHCGACNASCVGVVANGTARCDAAGEIARCVVDACEPGYYRFGDATCVKATDTSCKPCSVDADCVVPGDRCLPTEDGSYCGLDCAEGNLHLLPAGTCPDDYTCQADQSPLVGTHCVPVTRSCTCTPQTPGAGRVCSVVNDHGTCFGTRTCDALAGWSECDAATPAAEACNTVDDDCNGTVDDLPGVGSACARTVEGVGTCLGTRVCTAADAALVCSAKEPVAETCNYADDDCDGATDEAFPSLYQSCSEGVGACRVYGYVLCTDDGQGTRCSASAAAPGAEVCNGVDDDCDGHTDEDWLDLGAVCFVGDGACRASGVRLCDVAAPAGPTVCSATPGPKGVEVCNGVDDDCDGAVDEDAPWADKNAVCTVGTGACQATGVKICSVAAPAGPTVCSVAPGAAGTEVCNEQDDDCDGQTDEAWADKNSVCSVGTGVCRASGIKVCDAATPAGPTVCSAVPGPQATEVCNGQDDDCDGQTDESWSDKNTVCTVGTGVCRASGIKVCDAAAPAGPTVCSATPGPKGAESCNEQDDDCDGATDEDWTDKNTGCTVGKGVCLAVGVRVCDLAAPLGPTVCNVQPGPSGVEFCNGRDDDCDGSTDENWPLKGSSCSAGKGICAKAGVVVCDAAAPATTRCDAVPGPAAALEACNLQDDTCDGTTDEDFVDAGGRYVRDTACGNCFTDCTAIYDLPRAYGACDPSLAVPACRMHCDAAAFDLNAIPDDGCEFGLDATAIYVSTADGHADDLAGCGRGPWGTGPGNRPCRTIARGLLEATTALPARTQVLVADGLYEASVRLEDGIALTGGYRADTWERHLASTLTVVRAPSGAGAVMTVLAEGLVEPTLLEGFVIQGQTAVTPGESSYALWIADCGPALTVAHNVIQGGNGAAGTAGTRGEDGWDGQAGFEGEWTIETTAVSLAQCLALSVRPGNQYTEGDGGWLYCGPDNVSGGAGGAADCPRPLRQASGLPGQSADGGPGVGGFNGDGGYDHTTNNCSTFPLTDVTTQGSDGSDGTGGAEGTSGAGCADLDGAVAGNLWSGGAGSDATDGSSGGGGGGGGAGGGVDVTTVCPTKPEDTLGGSGGGGGSGGCLGLKGTGGGSGGGSFAVFVSFTAPSAGLPVLTGNTVTRGYGGAGGAGGAGGVGGLGGLGAPGGRVQGAYSSYLGTGGAGGDGGPGGHGGGGGGGCGGPAYGLFVHNATATPTWHQTNTLAGGGTGGTGGAGGPSAGQSGTAGVDGGTADRNY